MSDDLDEIILATAGTCMWPWVWPDGEIRVQRCAPDDLRPGEIAVWFDGRHLLSHRVVAVGDGTFVTKPDSSGRRDEPAGASQLLGRVVAFRVGGLSWSLAGPVGRAAGRLVVGLPWLVPAARRTWACLRRGLGQSARIVRYHLVRRQRR